MNVYNSYLEKELEEKIYMEISEKIDMPDKKNKALLPMKGLYGLKQSSWIWHQKFHKFLISIGFR